MTLTNPDSKFNKSEKNVNVFCNSNKIPFFEFRTQNGIDVIVSQDKTRQIASAAFMYKVGSRDEKINERGVAHLFEHLMFQGSRNIKKTEHFKYVQEVGGATNAFTSADYTVYFEQVPSNFLETCFWLESDRLYTLDLTEVNLQNQKDVVIEERMQNYVNVPYGMYFIKIIENLLKGSSYQHPTIGYDEDILNFSLDNAMAFHNNYYRPDNLIISVCGDVEPDNVLSIVEKYFSQSKPGAVPVNDYGSVIDLTEDKFEEVEDNVKNPALFLGYKMPGINEKMNIVADILFEILLNSTSSRLYRNLVYDKRKVLQLGSSLLSWQNCSVNLYKFYYHDLNSRELILKTFDEEIEKIMNGSITEKELEKAKNQKMLSWLLGVSTVMNKNIQLLFNKFHFKDPEFINHLYDIIESVTLEDLIEFVNKNIYNKHRYILNYIPSKKK